MNSSCAPAITEIVEGFTPAARSETIAGPELEGEPPQAAKASGKSRIALCIDSSGMNGTSGRDDDLAGHLLVPAAAEDGAVEIVGPGLVRNDQIGRASCRERV